VANTQKHGTRTLSDVEIHERTDDLEKALNLFGSVASRLDNISPIIEAILEDADRLHKMCERNPVLRAAMVSRRLSIQPLIRDIRGTKLKVSTISKFVGKTRQSKRNELEEVIRDPELLR
jgi:hypothetical protein